MISYTIELVSDGEIGSGLGGEMVNNYVTRDLSGNPVIRAAHLKGVLRQTLTDIFTPLNLDDQYLKRALGSPGWQPGAAGGSGEPAGIDGAERFSDASLTSDPRTEASSGSVRLLTRTALDPATGSIKAGSLRTSEAIKAGTRFAGRVYASGDPAGDLVIRLGLLSLRSLGAHRNRGAGSCVVTIAGEDRSPGQILKQLAGLAERPQEKIVPNLTPAIAGAVPGVVLYHLTFEAESPVLCPERPVVSNILQSGLAIPAAAVQGALLTGLNELDPGLATKCFEDPRFRAWPLHPSPPDDPPDGLPVRVSLTHRVAKIIAQEALLADSFHDEAIEGPWYERPTGSPLKAQDGVLCGSPQDVALWRSADMPRVFTTHGVHIDPNAPGQRNLFSVEAMAPGTWRGLLAVPGELAPALESMLEARDRRIGFGKARSIRGIGRLQLRRTSFSSIMAQRKGHADVLIAQSPIALPDTATSPVIQDELNQIATAWAARHQLGTVATVWASSGLRFGWNRSGKAGARDHGRARAMRVVLPGAVVRLDREVDPERLFAALLDGPGGWRERGFGCLLPHPGKARRLYSSKPQVKELRTEHADAIRRAMAIFATNRVELSAAQVSSLLDRLVESPAAAQNFLNAQAKRGSRGWQKWDASFKELSNWLTATSPQAAQVSLELLRDLLTGGKERQAI